MAIPLDPETLDPDKGKSKSPLARLRAPKPDETPRQGRGRPAGGGMSRAKLETELGGLLVGINLAVVMVPPLAADVLSDSEIVLLSRGLCDQAERSPRFKGWLVSLVKSQSSLGLLIALPLIIGRRAIRHGLMPGMSTEPVVREFLDVRLAAIEEALADPKGFATLMSTMAPAAQAVAEGAQELTETMATDGQEGIAVHTVIGGEIRRVRPAVGRPKVSKRGTPEFVAPAEA